MAGKKFDDVISEIPDYFYPAFAGELVAVFGTNVLKPWIRTSTPCQPDALTRHFGFSLNLQVLL